MKGASKIVVQLTALTGVGASGWYLGKLSECENRCRNKEKDDREYENFLNFINVKRVPGLPLFGTVSAATPIVPSESQQVDNMGSTFSAVGTSRISQIMKYGFPGLDNIRSFEDFVLSYDRRNRTAHWVFEHLTKDRVHAKENIDRSKSEFKSDESIHPFFRSSNSDYKGSGYDRGHLAAAGNHRAHQTHMNQTFYLSNIAPQVGKGFNRDSWNRLEKHVRKLTSIYTDVYVCTGPLYLPKIEADGKKYVKYEVIGANHVAVPTHFYKIVVGEMANGTLEMEAFVMPNAPIDDNTPLTNFQVPPESVERAAGLLFFDKLSRSKLARINGKKS